jgi:hypothetical protein
MTARRVSFDEVEIVEEKGRFRHMKTTIISVNSFEQNYRHRSLSPLQKHRRRSTRRTGEALQLPRKKTSMESKGREKHYAIDNIQKHYLQFGLTTTMMTASCLRM